MGVLGDVRWRAVAVKTRLAADFRGWAQIGKNLRLQISDLREELCGFNEEDAESRDSEMRDAETRHAETREQTKTTPAQAGKDFNFSR